VCIVLGVSSAQRRADNCNGSASTSNRSRVCDLVDPSSQTGYNGKAILNQKFDQLTSALLTLWRGLTRPHYRDRAAFDKIPCTAIIKYLNGMLCVPQPSGIFACTVNSNAIRCDATCSHFCAHLRCALHCSRQRHKI